MPEPHAPATKYRAHRGSLEDAMRTEEPCTSRAELIAILKRTELMPPFYPTEVEVKHYCYDQRIRWETYIVTIRGVAVGFTNGPLESEGEQAMVPEANSEEVKAAIDAHRTNRAKIDDLAQRQEKAEGRMAAIERELIEIRANAAKLREKVETLSSFA